MFTERTSVRPGMHARLAVAVAVDGVVTGWSSPDWPPPLAMSAPWLGRLLRLVAVGLRRSSTRRPGCDRRGPGTGIALDRGEPMVAQRGLPEFLSGAVSMILAAIWSVCSTLSSGTSAKFVPPPGRVPAT